MPRKEAEPAEKPASIEDKLDAIIFYLHKMERRDHMRMIGAYIKSMISLASLLILVGSSVWFLLYGEQFIQDMTEQMIKQSMGSIPTMDSLKH